MKNIKRQLSKVIRPIVQQMADELADLIQIKIDAQIAKLTESFEIAVSSYASELENDGDLALPGTRKPKTSGGRQNTCRNCGAVGFTAKTCGKTHNLGATEHVQTTGRETGAPRKSSKTPPVDETETAPAPTPPRVPPVPPRAQPAPAARSPRPEVNPFRAPPASPNPRPVITPKRTVKREKALEEIRVATIARQAVAKRELDLDRVKIKERPDAEDRERVPHGTPDDDDDPGMAPLSEREVLTEFRASDIE